MPKSGMGRRREDRAGRRAGAIQRDIAREPAARSCSRVSGRLAPVSIRNCRETVTLAENAGNAAAGPEPGRASFTPSRCQKVTPYHCRRELRYTSRFHRV